MKKILVTAFEPFGGRKANPALHVMAALNPSSLGPCRLVKSRLPVKGRAVGPLISRLIAKHSPDLVVSLGLAEGETGLRFERFGVNVMDYRIKDNAGEKPFGVRISPSGPAAYEVTADPLRMAAAARRAGVPAYVSNHAGGYVCNTLVYGALRAIEASGSRARYAFVHLPLTTELALKDPQGKALPASLPLALLARGVAAAIKSA